MPTYAVKLLSAVKVLLSKLWQTGNVGHFSEVVGGTSKFGLIDVPFLPRPHHNPLQPIHTTNLQ